KLAEADVRLQQRLTERTRRLIGTSSASQEDYDRDLGALEKAQATVGSMKAARDRAKLYLNYTHVLSPVSGRISRRLVDPGNLVKADDTILTTIVTEDPLYAYFDVNERTYLDLLKGAPSEVSARSADAKLVEGDALPVLMRLANEDEFTRLGRVDFID